ncbi:hypothetical protein B0H14DRAFT_350007 [Mycena olivaceomarginata]|nr:hypothetical protein B0H14DRAFT_350007 [Mycena olivaceomarginata]
MTPPSCLVLRRPCANSRCISRSAKTPRHHGPHPPRASPPPPLHLCEATARHRRLLSIARTLPRPRIFPLPPLPIHTPEPHRPRTTTARARASPSTTTRCTPTSPPSRDRGRVARVPPPMLRRHPHTTHPIGTRTRTQTFGWVRALGRRRAVETCSTGTPVWMSAFRSVCVRTLSVYAHTRRFPAPPPCLRCTLQRGRHQHYLSEAECV